MNAQSPGQSPQDDIVITGTGAICPLGNSVEEIRENLQSGKTVGGRSTRGAKVSDLKIDISPQLARSMGKHLFLLVSAAQEAFTRARLDNASLAPEQIGFFAGMGMVDYRIEDLLPAVLKSLGPDGELDYTRFFSGSYQEIYPLWPLAMLNNVAFCQAAIHLGIRGENSTFAPHADGGIMAVAEAVHVLREGRAKAMLAGGVSEEISPISQARAHVHGLTGPDVLGECGAMLVLETRAAAGNRGVKPLGRISGCGFACKTGRADRPAAAAVAMETALSHAGLNPNEIDLVFLHSPGEAEAIASVFGDLPAGPAIVTSNSLFGEVFAAGPIVNTILGLTIFESQRILPALTTTRGEHRTFSNILINAVSYEGQCASLVIQKER